MAKLPNQLIQTLTQLPSRPYCLTQISQLHCTSASQRFWNLLRFDLRADVQRRRRENDAEAASKQAVYARSCAATKKLALAICDSPESLPKYAFFIKHDVALPVKAQSCRTGTNEVAVWRGLKPTRVELYFSDNLNEFNPNKFRDKPPLNPWSPQRAPKFPHPCYPGTCGQSAQKTCPPPPPPPPKAAPEPPPCSPCPPVEKPPCSDGLGYEARSYISAKPQSCPLPKPPIDNPVVPFKPYVAKSYFSTYEPVSRPMWMLKTSRNYSSDHPRGRLLPECLKVQQSGFHNSSSRGKDRKRDDKCCKKKKKKFDRSKGFTICVGCKAKPRNICTKPRRQPATCPSESPPAARKPTPCEPDVSWKRRVCAGAGLEDPGCSRGTCGPRPPEPPPEECDPCARAQEEAEARCEEKEMRMEEKWSGRRRDEISADEVRGEGRRREERGRDDARRDGRWRDDRVRADERREDGMREDDRREERRDERSREMRSTEKRRRDDRRRSGTPEVQARSRDADERGCSEDEAWKRSCEGYGRGKGCGKGKCGSDDPPMRSYSTLAVKKHESTTPLVVPVRSIRSNGSLLKKDDCKRPNTHEKRKKIEILKKELREMEECIANIKCGGHKKERKEREKKSKDEK